MHSSRTFCRAPTAYRVIRAPAARNMSIFGPSPFLPRYHQPNLQAFGGGFNDLFRVIDDLATTVRNPEHFQVPAQLRATAPTFQPRFDVREQDGVYELRGELPGVDSKNLDVEFTDAQTLIIRGTTEQVSQASSTPSAPETDTTMSGAIDQAETAAVETTTNTTAVDASDAASVHSSSSYQKATVEDEDAADEVRSIASSEVQATPAGSVSGEQPVSKVQATAPAPHAQPSQQTPSQSRYWVSERSVGSFQRVFQFPARVNTDDVKASLVNGILTVIVPKAKAPGVTRISVQ